MKKSDPLIIKEFGQGFYAVLSFTGQQDFYILSAVVQDAPLEAQRFNAVTPEEWAELFRLSKTQGVTAVVFEKLSTAFNECEDFPRPPKTLTLNWYAQSHSIERKWQPYISVLRNLQD